MRDSTDNNTCALLGKVSKKKKSQSKKDLAIEDASMRKNMRGNTLAIGNVGEEMFARENVKAEKLARGKAGEETLSK